MHRECRERFLRYRLQRRPLVSDHGMHHGTCVTHVPWCMSGSLTRYGGESVPAIPGACATCSFTHLARGPWLKRQVYALQSDCQYGFEKWWKFLPVTWSPNVLQLTHDSVHNLLIHYCDVTMNKMASQITSNSTVYLTVFRCASKKTSKLHMNGPCERNPPVNGGFPSVTRKMFPFDDVIMLYLNQEITQSATIEKDKTRIYISPAATALKTSHLHLKIFQCDRCRSTAHNISSILFKFLHTLHFLQHELHWLSLYWCYTLQWRHNERHGVSNRRRLNYLLNYWFRCRSKKSSKLRVTGLCEGNSPVTGEFLAQKASNAGNVSIWWRHLENSVAFLNL